jgi:hypothetical protein
MIEGIHAARAELPLLSEHRQRERQGVCLHSLSAFTPVCRGPLAQFRYAVWKFEGDPSIEGGEKVGGQYANAFAVDLVVRHIHVQLLNIANLPAPTQIKFEFAVGRKMYRNAVLDYGSLSGISASTMTQIPYVCSVARAHRIASAVLPAFYGRITCTEQELSAMPP